VLTLFHPVGWHNPATSVADHWCQVHGIQGLYVMDAGVIPNWHREETDAGLLAG